MNPHQLPDQAFHFGTQYYRMVPFREDWERDIANIKALGMDVVRFWALWKWAEPKPGKFYFDDLHELIRIAADNDLKVILVIEMDKIPAWVTDHLAGARLVNLDGSLDINAWGYANWDHPVLRRLAERYMLELTRQLGGYEEIIAWDVWNEPDLPEDASELSRRKFIGWLKGRFDRFEDLVERIHLPRFDDWEDLRIPTSTWETQLYLLYQEFRIWSATERIEWAYGIVKGALPERNVTVHVHCDEHPFTFRWFGNTCEVGWYDWTMSRTVDFYITACHEFYQGEGIYTRPANAGAYVANIETKRSISDGQFWTTGLAGGASKGGWPRITGINPKENLFSLWMIAAHEAKGIVYWQYRVERLLGPEAPGWGLMNFDGTRSFRAEESARFIAALRPYEEGLMQASIARPTTAVLYSLKSHIMDETQPQLRYILGFEGACYALWMNNVTFDVISEDDVDTDAVEGLRTVIVPNAQCLKEGTLLWLQRFVEGGGAVVFEAATGAFDEYGILNAYIPGGPEFVRAAGIQEKDVLFAEELVIETAFGPLPGVKERRLFEAAPGAEMAGTYPDGSPGAVVTRYGEGRFIYLSTYVCSAIRQGDDVGQTRTLVDLVGLRPEVAVSPLATVTARILENGTEQYIFVFNHSNEGRSSAEITLPTAPSEVEEVFKEDAAWHVEGNVLSVDMAHREVLVLRAIKA